jgi:thiamine-phosphate pyrophosphorylase
MPGNQERLDRLFAMRLGDGDQRHVGCRAPRESGCPRDRGVDGGQAIFSDDCSIAAAISGGMTLRQPLPRIWLFTDERLGDAVLAAVSKLPRAAGIVFRHYSLAEGPRRALYERVRAQARAARPDAAARRLARVGHELGRHGWHGWDEGRACAGPVHDLRDAGRAEAGGAGSAFVSPVFSDPLAPRGRNAWGRRFAQLACKARVGR